jgi:hypothetical protein
MARHGFRGDGAHGQFCVVVPDADLVVATTARVDDMQLVLEVLWDHLLPALDTDAGGDDRYASEARLTERLESLALPVVVPSHAGPDGTVRLVVQETVADQPLASGAQLSVTRDGADHRLGLTLGSTELSVPCGGHHWAEGQLGAAPVVCRGGWTGPDTFEADLLLIETPHRIRLRGNGSRLQAKWNARPLSGAALETHLSI